MSADNILAITSGMSNSSTFSVYDVSYSWISDLKEWEDFTLKDNNGIDKITKAIHTQCGLPIASGISLDDARAFCHDYKKTHTVEYGVHEIIPTGHTINIKVVAVRGFQTTDGKLFDDEQEASEWQDAIDFRAAIERFCTDEVGSEHRGGVIELLINHKASLKHIFNLIK